MKRRLFFLMMVIVSCCVSATAQDGRVTVKGTVIDSHTGGPVAFANLGLLGTVAGTASDIDGIFELTVPDKYSRMLSGLQPWGMPIWNSRYMKEPVSLI